MNKCPLSDYETRPSDKKKKDRKKYCNRGINKLLRLIQTQDNQEDFVAEFSFKQDFEE